MIALHSIVVPIRQLGIPPGERLPIVPDLVKGFVEEAKSLDGWASQHDEGAAQAAFDLSFLSLLVGQEGRDILVSKLLANVMITAYFTCLC